MALKDEWLTQEEIAKFLGVSIKTVQNQSGKNGRLYPAVKTTLMGTRVYSLKKILNLS